MRFIVRPRVEVAEEAQETDANDGDVDKPPPDYVRRAFRSLKMLVDDPRVSQMLFDNLSDLAPVAFEIFENLDLVTKVFDRLDHRVAGSYR